MELAAPEKSIDISYFKTSKENRVENRFSGEQPVSVLQLFQSLFVVVPVTAGKIEMNKV